MMKIIENYIARVFLFSVLLWLPFFCYGQTSLPSTINSDYTLTKANSPYRANSDVTVNSSVKLTVEPGVIIEFVENAGLYVKGRLVMEGEPNDWIHLKTAPGNSDWDVVTLENTYGTSILRYVEITGSTNGKDSDRDRAALNAANVSEVILEHVRIHDVASCVYYHTTNERCTFKDCYFKCDENGSVFFLVRSDVLIQDCEFAGVVGNNSDAIDFDMVTADIIGNSIYGMTGSDSDGIDMGSQSEVYLKENLIQDCTDSGIEAEEGSVIVAEKNIIINCNIGVTVKENAIGTFINNTFYNNDICFAAYSETNTNGNGGTITAVNNIIYETATNFTSQNGSSLTFRYNLTQSVSLSGVGNTVGNPLFVNPGSRDFHLQANSPAIDAGDPNSSHDPDGTRADIGAYYYEQDIQKGLVISEIHFNPITEGISDDEGEFIELLNTSDDEIAIGNYYLSGAIQFTFPVGASIDAGEYILLVANPDRFSDFIGDMYSWTMGHLNNNGDLIRLSNDSGIGVIDLTYSVLDPWPSKTGVSNLSIELIDPYLDMSDSQSWRHSFSDGGTPGSPNKRGLLDGVFVNELVSKYGTLFADEFGNYSDWIELYNDNSYPVYLMDLYLSDDEQDQLKFHLPSGDPDKLRIPAKGFLILFADGFPNLGVCHLSFLLRSSGEQVCLVQNYFGESIFLDKVSFGPLETDQSFGRLPDGSENFVKFDYPSPGESNEGNDPSIYDMIFINELVSKFGDLFADENGNYSDWIELYNGGNDDIDVGGLFITDDLSNPTKHRILTTQSELTTIPARSSIVFFADALPNLGVRHLNFQLSSGGEQLGLFYSLGDELVEINSLSFGPLDTDISFGRMPNGSANLVVLANASPGDDNIDLNQDFLKGLFVNELVANYESRFSDEHGNFSDWLEIYNDNSYPVDLGGFTISYHTQGDLPEPIVIGFSDSTFIPAKGFAVYRADELPSFGYNHLNFRMPSSGGNLSLGIQHGSAFYLVNSGQYPYLDDDISYGRVSDGSVDWIKFVSPTPGYSNTSSSVELWDGFANMSFIAHPVPANERLDIVIEGIPPQVKHYVIRVYNNQGRLVKDFGDMSNTLGTVYLHWNFKLESDRKIKSGLYFIILESSILKFSRMILIY